MQIFSNFSIYLFIFQSFFIIFLAKSVTGWIGRAQEWFGFWYCGIQGGSKWLYWNQLLNWASLQAVFRSKSTLKNRHKSVMKLVSNFHMKCKFPFHLLMLRNGSDRVNYTLLRYLMLLGILLPLQFTVVLIANYVSFMSLWQVCCLILPGWIIKKMWQTNWKWHVFQLLGTPLSWGGCNLGFCLNCRRFCFNPQQKSRKKRVLRYELISWLNFRVFLPSLRGQRSGDSQKNIFY